jgi:phenylalanyl-tRNA synthetase beta chain
VAALAALGGIDWPRQPIAAVDGGHFGWQEGHSATAGDMGQGWVARFGLLNLAMVKSLGVEGGVYAGTFTILPEKLSADHARRRFAEFSLFPAAWRDLALVVEADVPRAAAGNAFAAESIEVFDVYQGKGLPAGKKSLAFNLVFRSPHRTLIDEEVNAVFTRIQQEITADGKVAIRA